MKPVFKKSQESRTALWQLLVCLLLKFVPDQNILSQFMGTVCRIMAPWKLSIYLGRECFYFDHLDQNVITLMVGKPDNQNTQSMAFGDDIYLGDNQVLWWHKFLCSSGVFPHKCLKSQFLGQVIHCLNSLNIFRLSYYTNNCTTKLLYEKCFAVLQEH